LEGSFCKFGYRVGLHYILSIADIWINREVQKDVGGYVKDVCHASAEKVGVVASTYGVLLQKWLSRVTKDESV